MFSSQEQVSLIITTLFVVFEIIKISGLTVEMARKGGITSFSLKNQRRVSNHRLDAKYQKLEIFHCIFCLPSQT